MLDGRLGGLASFSRATELSKRSSRTPDYQLENRSLVALTEALANAPRTVLQLLAESALQLCEAHSAGISLLEDFDNRSRFHWRAIAGEWSAFVGEGTPREFGPCGLVVDLGEALTCSHPERDFPYIDAVQPGVTEGLLVPFYVSGEPRGTVWVVAHDDTKRFDLEDLRIVTTLTKFASAAHQTLSSSTAKDIANDRLQDIATAAQKFEALVENSDDAIVAKTLEGIVTSWNRGAERIFGYSAAEAIGQPITFLMQPDRHEEERGIIQRIRRGERVPPFDTVRRRKDGQLIDVSVTVSPVKDLYGRIIGASKIARDITERTAAQRSQALLLREMRHRVNNLFLVTNAIVNLSSRSAKTPADMAKAVQGRLSALTRAHALTRPEFTETAAAPRFETTLIRLIAAIFEPYVDDSGAPRYNFEGPDLPITQQATTNVALVFHELATNAAKYGALSSSAGSVGIRAVLDGDSVRLSWDEFGGPSVVKPAKEGFGTLLIRQVVVNQFHGTLDQVWNANGLTIEIVVPQSSIAPTALPLATAE